MSPMISMLSDIEPNQSACCVSGDAGITSAMTFPRLVTRSVDLVLSTSSNRERHLALNSEMAIDFFLLPDFMGLLKTQFILPWSSGIVITFKATQRHGNVSY